MKGAWRLFADDVWYIVSIEYVKCQEHVRTSGLHKSV